MRIEGLKPSSVLNIKGFKDIVAKLGLGDKISVQIVGIEGDELTLRFSNGANVTATALFPMDVNLGDFLELNVKSKNDTQVVLETVKNTYEETKSKEVIDTLMSMKKAPNERNIEVGRALANQHMALNSENFKSVMSILSNFEGMDIDRAVFVVANNLDKLDGGIELLGKYEQNKVEMGKVINKLMASLISEQNTFALSDIISEYESVAVEKVIDRGENNLKQLIGSFNGTDDEIEQIAKSMVKHIFNNSTEHTNDGVNRVRHNITELLKFTTTKEDIKSMLPYKENKFLFEFLDTNKDAARKIAGFFNDKRELQKFIIGYKHEEALIFKNIRENENQSVYDKVKEFLGDFKTIVDEKGLKGDLDVNKLYTTLLSKLDIFEQGLEKHNLTNGEKIFSAIENLRQNIDFTSSINNVFNYYQIPLSMNQKDTNLDLYIVKNTKEQKKIDPNNATLFISLDTQNLGLVETLIHVYNGKIDFNFKLEDDNVIGLFARMQGMLEKLLKDKGYTLNKIRFDLNPKRTNILNFEHVIRDNKNVIRDVFDVRI